MLETGEQVTAMASKLGTAKGVARSRIWIEGKRLEGAGFTVGRRFDVVRVADGSWRLELAEDGARKVSGKGDKWFPESAAVAITYGLASFTTTRATIASVRMGRAPRVSVAAMPDTYRITIDPMTGRYAVTLSGELVASFRSYEGAARWVERWGNAR